MNPKDRRKFPRIGTHNPHLNITLTGGGAQSVSQIRCRIVNISIDGLQIETQYPIESQEAHFRAIDSENNPNEIRGRAVYCEKISPEMFHIGLAFIGSNMDKYKFISQLMKIKDEMTTLEIDSTHKALNESSTMIRCTEHE
jgi:hypothetical protein